MINSPKKSQSTAETSTLDSMKLLLSDRTQRIRLDDFVSAQARHFLEEIGLEHFPVQPVPNSNEEILQRIGKYESLSAKMETIGALLAYWGDVEHLFLLGKIVGRIAESDRGSGGRWYGSIWDGIRLYY